jgi:putative FmdB family regulatory protein
MPLYEYECEKCAHRFEKILKFSDPPIEVCPKCGGPVRKLMSSPAIQFKGSGWYITDYARKDSAAAGKTDKSDKSDKSESSDGKSDKSETKTDSKSETKSDAKPGKPDSPSTTKS